MEKENKFKLKISRIFTSSCKTQDLNEVIDHQNPILTPQTTPLMEDNYNNTLFSSHLTRPNQTPLPLMCKPRCPESFDQMVRENCVIHSAGNPLPRRKITGKYSLLSPSGEFSGRRCPPVSPVSPLKQGTKKKKKRRSKKEKSHLRNNQNSFSSSNETEFRDWFSSDDEREDDDVDETETLFSSAKSLSFSSKSISLSSDSEPQTRTRTRNPRKKMGSGSGSRLGSGEVGVVPLKGRVKDTFAVVKSSSDPYNDFRTSMVEMIIEKQIFGSKELEQLLKCFLSLNAPHHHCVIVEVFTEIWDALFSYCN